MRDYKHFDRYLNELQDDVYPQPPDEKQTEYGREVIDNWVSQLLGCKTVLDLGCGQGQFQPMFAKWGIVWTGVTLGSDYNIGKEKGLDIKLMDFTFMDEFNNSSFDLLFARHSLEHSPFPLITLMEWYRISKQWLCVIIPNPTFHTFIGRNHYGVMAQDQFVWLAKRAGWHIIWDNPTDFEFRYMLEKTNPVKE